jgi:hypothetical protein
MKLSAEGAPGARALRFDFQFAGGGGYAVARREVDLALPENYAFTFRIRGEASPNNLEFKLIDSTGANVWWCNRRNVAFPRAWETFTIKRRQIEFAWGPAGGGTISHVAAIEIAITAGSGGEGTVWLDQLELRPLAPPGEAVAPVARASSSRKDHDAALAADGDSTTFWWAQPGDKKPWLELDLGGDRELGGLVVDWVAGRHAATMRSRPRRMRGPGSRSARSWMATGAATFSACPRPRRAICGWRASIRRRPRGCAVAGIRVGRSSGGAHPRRESCALERPQGRARSGAYNYIARFFIGSSSPPNPPPPPPFHII